ncbi:MAG: ABC transporter ATP-binding protein [Patescibacteria group bacterium]
MRHISAAQATPEYSAWQLFQDLRQLLRPYRRNFWLASFIRVLGDLAWLYPAFAFATLVTFLTQYRTGQSLRTVWIVLGLWLAATVTRNLSQFFAKLLGFRVAEKLAIDSALQTIRHIFRLDMAWQERENSGNKIKRIQNAGDGLNRIIRIWFNSLLEIGVNLIAMNIIIASFDWTVMVGLIIFLLSYFFIAAYLTRRAGQASYIVNTQEEEVNGLLFEAINNIRTVKALALAKALADQLLKSCDDLFAKIGIRVFRYQSRNSFLSFWAGACKIALIALIVRGFLHGQYAIGFLVLFNSYFSDLRMSIDELANASQEFVSAKFSIARMKDILNEPLGIDDERGKKALPKNWQNIRFKNVSFAYGQQKVLQDLSFEVRRGERIGIVGLSGAGKSTLFKLLLKEREEFSGDIRFDGLSLKKIRNQDYFRQVSVVLQDTEVFNFSLLDNITIANDARRNDHALLHQALDIAHLQEVTAKLPQGLETIIGEKGVKLSGGERQRLGLARAVFKEPQLLLLDEATSQLDLESEEKIRDSLHKFFKHVTAIVIAHRLSTIREMDKILVMEGGRLIESGNFAELYARRGRFFELWEKQKL